MRDKRKQAAKKEESIDGMELQEEKEESLFSSDMGIEMPVLELSGARAFRIKPESQSCWKNVEPQGPKQEDAVAHLKVQSLDSPRTMNLEPISTAESSFFMDNM